MGESSSIYERRTEKITPIKLVKWRGRGVDTNIYIAPSRFICLGKKNK